MGADDDRREGKFDEAKGTVKEKAGDMTGDEDLERQGEKDRAKGNVKQAVGKEPIPPRGVPNPDYKK